MMARSRRGLAWIAALLALASLPIARRDARAFDQGISKRFDCQPWAQQLPSTSKRHS